MATVYIWKSTHHTGHASIDIGGYYISFHPNLSNNRTLTHEEKLCYSRNSDASLLDVAEHSFDPMFTSYHEDVTTYGEPVNVVSISDLDEESVAAYIREEFDKDHPAYGLSSCNCSSVVATLLFLGKHQYVDDGSWVGSLITKMRHLHKILYDDHSGDLQNHHGRRFEAVGDHIEHIVPVIVRQAARPRAPMAKVFSAIVGALDFTRRAFFWTPGDVLHLAIYFRDHQVPDPKLRRNLNYGQ